MKNEMKLLEAVGLLSDAMIEAAVIEDAMMEDAIVEGAIVEDVMTEDTMGGKTLEGMRLEDQSNALEGVKIKRRKNLFRFGYRIAAATGIMACFLVAIPALAKEIPTIYRIVDKYAPALADHIIPNALSDDQEGIRMQVEAVYVEGKDASLVVSFSDLPGYNRIFGQVDMFDSYNLSSYGTDTSIGGCGFLTYDEQEDKAFFLVNIMGDGAYTKEKIQFDVRTLLTRVSAVEKEIPLTQIEQNPAMKEVEISGSGGMRDRTLFAKLLKGRIANVLDTANIVDSKEAMESKDTMENQDTMESKDTMENQDTMESKDTMENQDTMENKSTAESKNIVESKNITDNEGIKDTKSVQNIDMDDLCVTGIAYADGILHVQSCRGNVEEADRHLQLKLFLDGEEYDQEMGVCWREEITGVEVTFDESWFAISPEELEKCRLVGIFHVADTPVHGNWKVITRIE